MKTAIAIFFDDNYLDKASVFLQSLSENYHAYEPLTIVCGVPEGTEISLESLYESLDIKPRIRLELLTISKDSFPWLAEIDSSHGWISSTAWYRLYMGSLLPDYDKVIYFDVDALIVENVQPILEYPMYSHFMAVMDITGVEFGASKTRGEVPWINSGMFIADLNWWRFSGVEEEFTEYIKNNTAGLLADEDAINNSKEIRSNWSALPFVFNFYCFKKDAHGITNFDESDILPVHYKHAIFMHFAGSIKPWTYKDLTGNDDKSILGSEWRRRLEIIKFK